MNKVSAGGLAVVFLVAAGLRLGSATDAYFWSDTADYVRAGHVGLTSLLLENHSVSLLGLAHKLRDPQFRQHPFDTLDREGDNLALRHLHGPASTYLLAVAYDFGLSERQQRIFWGLLGALSCTLLAAALSLLGAGTLPAIAAGLLAAVDSRNLWTDVEPSPPHTLYLLCSMLFLALAAVYWRTGRRGMLYACAVVLAAATLTFEFAIALLAAFAVGFVWEWWRKRNTRDLLGSLARFVAVYLAALLAFCPGGFVRGTVLISTFGNLGVLLRWKTGASSPSSLPVLRTLLGPIEVTAALLLLFAFAFILLARRYPKGAACPPPMFATCGCYAVFAVLFGLSSHFQNLPYAAEVFFPVLLFLVLTACLAALEMPWIASAAVIVLLAGGADSLLHTLRSPHEWGPAREIVKDVDAIALPPDSVVLVNDINVWDALRLYVPRDRFELTASPASIEPRRPEDAPRVRLGVWNTGSLDAAERDNARAQFPVRAVYRANYAEWWLGEKR